MRLPRTSAAAQSIALVIVVTWALAAVLMLTRTLVSANSIDGHVVTIKDEVGGIDGNLDFVALAVTTAEVADQINTAAKPLAAQLEEVVAVAGSIDRNAVSILDTATEINGNVKDINTTALAINSTVKSINSNVREINASARAINANARAINASVLSINANAVSIGATVDSINGNLAGVLGVVRSINGDDTAALADDLGVSGINRRADVIIDLVNSIKSDTGDILAEVRDQVLKHANSIDCSAIVQTAGAIGPGGDACRS